MCDSSLVLLSDVATVLKPLVLSVSWGGLSFITHPLDNNISGLSSVKYFINIQFISRISISLLPNWKYFVCHSTHRGKFLSYMKLFTGQTADFSAACFWSVVTILWKMTQILHLHLVTKRRTQFQSCSLVLAALLPHSKKGCGFEFACSAVPVWVCGFVSLCRIPPSSSDGWDGLQDKWW